MNNQSSMSWGRDNSWKWSAIIGVLLMVLGAAVIGAATLATLAISWLVGFAFLLGGIGQLFHAFRSSQLYGAVSRFLFAALSIVAGVVVLRSPIAGAETITLILSFYLLFAAVAKGFLAFESKKGSGRGSLIFSSVVSLCLGAYLLASFPAISLIIPGVFLGVDLIVYGVSVTLISGSLRNKANVVHSTDFRRAG